MSDTDRDRQRQREGEKETQTERERDHRETCENVLNRAKIIMVPQKIILYPMYSVHIWVVYIFVVETAYR